MLRRILPLLAFVALSLTTGCIEISPFYPTELETALVEPSGRWFEGSRVALIDIDGFIGNAPASWFTLGTSPADVKEKLQMAADDSSVKAVVLRISSPGGEATSSDLIYREVLKFKERTQLPVVAMIMNMGTSGGYYAACSADRIYASPTAVTGSVGVIMEMTNVEGLLGKIGVKTEAIKSGKEKDIGSPFRTMTPEDREILMNLNQSMFSQFVKAVRQGRPTMTDAQMAAIADGRVLTADQALELNLIDRIGYLDDAIAEAKTLAHIQHADVILYRARPSYNTNIYAGSPTDQLLAHGSELLLRQQGPRFLYLWAPGR